MGKFELKVDLSLSVYLQKNETNIKYDFDKITKFLYLFVAYYNCEFLL